MAKVCRRFHSDFILWCEPLWLHHFSCYIHNLVVVELAEFIDRFPGRFPRVFFRGSVMMALLNSVLVWLSPPSRASTWRGVMLIQLGFVNLLLFFSVFLIDLFGVLQWSLGNNPFTLVRNDRDNVFSARDCTTFDAMTAVFVSVFSTDPFGLCPVVFRFLVL